MGAGQRNGDRLAAAGADHGFPRLLCGLQEIEPLALALIENGDDTAAENLVLAVSQQLARGRVRHLDDAVGRGDEHRVRHAVQDVVQIVLVDRPLPQASTHALNGLLQLAELIAPPDFHRPRVVAVPDPLDTFNKRHDRRFEPARSAPGKRRADDSAQHRQATCKEQHVLQLRVLGEGDARGERRRRRGRRLFQHQPQLSERMRGCRARNALDHLADRHRCLGPQRIGARRRRPLPAEENSTGRVGDRHLVDGCVIHERLQPSGECRRVTRTNGTGDGVGGVLGSFGGACAELCCNTLAHGAFRHAPESARAAIVLPGEQRCENDHGEQHDHEGRARILQLEADCGHNRSGSSAADVSPYIFRQVVMPEGY